MSEASEIVDIARYRRALMLIKVKHATAAAKRRAGPPQLEWTGIPREAPQIGAQTSSSQLRTSAGTSGPTSVNTRA